MKIAMLTCLNSNTVCTGAACLRAFNERIRSFSRYKGRNDIELAAFMKCNGCETSGIPEEGRIYAADRLENGIQEKILRLSQEGIEAVHLGLCTKKKETMCPVIEKISEEIEKNGIQVIFGTH